MLMVAVELVGYQMVEMHHLTQETNKDFQT
jgi:hypothetical protein